MLGIKFIKAGSENEPAFFFTIPTGADRRVDTMGGGAYS
jgi:hypothetical protein